MSPYPNQDKYRKYVSALDVADRLVLNFDVNELLLWPPNLFAFTSSVLSLTSAYQLVVSPPRGERWPPSQLEISAWFDNLKKEAGGWLDDIKTRWRTEPGEAEFEDFFAKDGFASRFNQAIQEFKINRVGPVDNWWSEFVRNAGTSWASNLSDLDTSTFELINVGSSDPNEESRRASVLLKLLLAKTPVEVLAPWLTLYPLFREEVSISKLLCNADDQDRAEVQQSWRYAQAVITLHAIADEACVLWGINQEGDEKGFGGNARSFADKMLLRDGTMATIGNERCRVLPKRHNPNVGITLRSLSSNLAFHRSSIDVVWRQVASNPLSRQLDKDLKLNPCGEQSSASSSIISVLLLPWPMQIRAGDFTDYRTKKNSPRLPIALDENRYDFFVYCPEGSGFSHNDVIEMLKAAEEEHHPVSMLIMPESSIDSTSMPDLEKQLRNRATDESAVSVLIAGVREEPDEATFARNAVYCRTIRKAGRKSFTYEEEKREDKSKAADISKQYKHHRWKLDQGQIRQYGLSTVLDTTKQWWEAIKVERRRVSFVNLGNRLTICPLICEDLARQDPIADLIRHVGPNLVVTILMDGPQKTDRWSARYAGVLSEDPGSAVIALSSYGMVRRWSSPYRQMSNVVALWNDGKSPAREIELAQGAEGILLRLKVESECEPIADGRVEMFPTANISLLDVIQVYRKR